MLRGELHNRGSAGRCEACAETSRARAHPGLAIYQAVKLEIDHPTPAAGSATDGHSRDRSTAGGVTVRSRSGPRQSPLRVD
jgi:hypothetical protein